MGIMVPDDMNTFMVKDLVDENGGWRFDLLLPWMPNNLISKMFAIMPPRSDGIADRRAWGGTTDGRFTISSAYSILCHFNGNHGEVEWQNIWKLRVPERVRSFIWLVRHDRLITNYRKSKMHIGVPWCNHCVDLVEDSLHVLRDCPLAKSVWCNLLSSDFRNIFFTVNINDRVHLNLRQNLGRSLDRSWSCVWATGCYFLWTWRNREALGDSRLRPYRPWIFILDWLDHYKRADVNAITTSTSRAGVIDISWQKPEEGWILLNTDGASKSGEIAGCGGLLRNSHGQWISGFSRNLGRCNAYIAELWGVLDGLRLARARGIAKLKVHVDSQVVVRTLNNTNEGSFVGWRLIKKIRRMLEMDWEVKVCHSYREANICADALANMGCTHDHGFRIYEQCPASLSNLLLADIMGISTPRVIVA